MAYKTFIVTHAHARAPLTIKGKSLHDALIKEGLNPAIWKEMPGAPMEEVKNLGDNQGDGRQENN